MFCGFHFILSAKQAATTAISLSLWCDQVGDLNPRPPILEVDTLGHKVWFLRSIKRGSIPKDNLFFNPSHSDKPTNQTGLQNHRASQAQLATKLCSSCMTWTDTLRPIAMQQSSNSVSNRGSLSDRTVYPLSPVGLVHQLSLIPQGSQRSQVHVYGNTWRPKSARFESPPPTLYITKGAVVKQRVAISPFNVGNSDPMRR